MCDRYGVVLIFDEVISGFRFHPGGVQTLLGVTPDLTTLGKALGAGFSISALVGRDNIMQLIGKGRSHAGTFNGNVVNGRRRRKPPLYARNKVRCIRR
jgi:glutamate-1-semialdehyde 2,1-aminomutase